MLFYLIRCAETNSSRVPDPYSAHLSPHGIERAGALARLCRQWGIQFLCASTLTRAQEMADTIEGQVPGIERWDLEELEDLNVDDLMGEPTAGPLAPMWTDEQRRQGESRLWTRVMASLARIQIYAQRQSHAHVALVSHETVLHLLLLNWLGRDWRESQRSHLAMAPGSVSLVSVDPQGAATIEWLNRL